MPAFSAVHPRMQEWKTD